MHFRSILVVVPELIGRRETNAHRIAERGDSGFRWTGFA